MFFNVTKFCYVAGQYHQLSDLYRYVMVVIFVLLGVLCLFGNGFAFVLLISKKSFRKKRNVFLVSLIASDILYSVTFIPLFLIELVSSSSNCAIRSWRVLTFIFFFFTRILSAFLISLQTYIKTAKLLSKYDDIFKRYSFLINLLLIWLVPALAVLIIATTPVETNKTLGLLTLCCFIVTAFIIIVSYMMVLHGIKQAKKRSSSHAYDDAFKFVRLILISFLLTSIPLAICGIVLISFKYSELSQQAYKVIQNQVYGAALSITSVAAVVNPIVYFKNIKELNKTFFQCCFKNINSSLNNDTTAGKGEEGQINLYFYSQE